MFTGIIESLGTVEVLKKEGGNLHITIRSNISNELKIDQSVAHNGVCLTVINVSDKTHTVTAIDETLKKTDIGSWQNGDVVNLERCLKLGDRLDGHIVQGHVDTTAVCTDIKQENGSQIFNFKTIENADGQIVKKGSICINGVSLTVVSCTENTFSVAIIPYTLEHTNFKNIKAGSRVNIEYDIVGKYILSSLKKA